MPASDKFKDELQNNNFVGALKTALSEAIELEIVTWVVPADQDELGQDTPENALPGHLMRTRINLVDGDIDNEIGSHFVGSGPYTELRQFHLEQVQKGQDIIQKNLTNLKQLFEILVEKIHGLPQTEHLLTPNTVPEVSGSSWPSDNQRVALLADDSQMPEAASSTLVSGNPEAVDSLVDDDMPDEADPALVSGNPEAVDSLVDNEMSKEAAPDSISS
jgi:hypothetical protein